MSLRIFWAAIVGFLGGVFFRSFFSVGWYEIGFLLVVAAALFILGFVSRAQKSFLIGSLLVACSLGIVRMHSGELVPEPLLDGQIEQKVVIEGIVFDEPDARENSTRISIAADTLITKTGTTTITAGVLAIAPQHIAIMYGDRARATGVLRFPESFDAGSGREFNYPAYLAKDGIGYELSFAEIKKVGDGKRNPIKAGAIFIKRIYLEGIVMALPEPHAGLAGGITAGDKRALGGELTDVFRTVGLIHIVVLSGYNIMVVIGFLDRILSGGHRYVRFSLGIGVAIFFALITGLASSSVRAASMAVIATIGKATGRTYLAGRALATVAFLMVLWNPWLLAFDPGFQLSIIATWGLISIAPLVASKLLFVTERFGFREIAATTIGTQIAVLPLLLYQTGQLSLIALPANLLALIVVPWAMLASFIAGVFGVLAGPLAPIIGFPAYVLLSYILFVAEWAARIPFASITIGALSVATLFVCYAIIVGVVRIAPRSQTSSNS